MLSGISVICFATSYTVALVLEVTRLFFRSGVRGVAMFVFAGLGLFTHTVFLYHHAVHAAGYPLSNKQDWYFLAAWVLVTIYLYLSHYHPKTPFGVFLLPIVLALIGAGQYWADPTPFAQRPALAVWNVLHGTSLLLATVAVAVGFVSGVMYLEQAHRLKRKLPPRGGLRLPSLEWLTKVNGRAIVLAILLLALGIVSGAILNSIHREDQARRISFADPLVFGTVTMFVWLVISTGASFFYRPTREGRKVAYLTVLSFIFLVVVLGLGLLLGTRHGQALPEDHGARRPIPRTSSYPAGNLARMGATAGLSGSAGHDLPQEHCWTSQQWHPTCGQQNCRPVARTRQTVSPCPSVLSGGMA